jgi:hypothetical protein
MPVEMLIRRVDKINPNSDVQNARCTKRGDVIVVQPMGFDWSDAEINNPDWILIKVADLSLGDAETFLLPESPLGEREAQPLLKRRAKSIDLDGLTLDIIPNEQIHDSGNWSFIFTHTSAQIVNRTVIKPSAPVEVV